MANVIIADEMKTNIEKYKTVETLKDFAERKKIESYNARRFWAEGKRYYLDDHEDALQLARDWLIFSTK